MPNHTKKSCDKWDNILFLTFALQNYHYGKRILYREIEANAEVAI